MGAQVKAMYQKKYGEDVHDDGEARNCVFLQAMLEEKLADVKNLYEKKYGQEVDDERDPETTCVEKDGITWTVTAGSALRRGPPPTDVELEDKLAQVKALYQKKYGEDVHDDGEARNRVFLQARLEEKLADVKTLYEKKYGQDVDDEQDPETTCVEKDGITWTVSHRGAKSDTQCFDLKDWVLVCDRV